MQSTDNDGRKEHEPMGKRVELKHSDFWNEAEELVRFYEDEDANYIGLSLVDLIAATIYKRESRIKELEARIFELEVCN